ncbi:MULTISPECIES: EpsG family protein [unclassified Roseitalea]|uniref:EpsG family protein n=1 Tax=unclassified Roseitalea TaxID=2639107 RepID=UPI00273D6BBD|nr:MULTISPECIES: EpsG family protein [unclassified Roseitalea]
MLTYYFTFGFMLVANRAAWGDRTTRQVVYWSLLIAMFIFSGFRYQVGCDWSGYGVNFDIQARRSFQDALESREPAHWALITLIQRLGLSYTYLNVATSAIFFFGFHTLAKRQPNPVAFLVLAFPVLVINMPMSAIRQAVAIGFVCMAYSAFIDRKLIRYVTLLLLGSLFHSSAMMFLLLAPFVVSRYSINSFIVAGILSVPGLFFLLDTPAADLAVSRYIVRDVDAAGSAFRLGLLTLTGIGFLLYLRRPWRRHFPEDYKLASIGAWLMVAFFSLFFVSTVIGDRFGYYLIPIQLMIFARIPYLFPARRSTMMTLAPYALLTLVFFTWTQLSWHFQHCYLPYQMRFG